MQQIFFSNNFPPSLRNENYKDDKKGVDRSSTVIAKDPEGKQSTQSFYLINSFYFEQYSRYSTLPASKSLAIEQQTQLCRASLKNLLSNLINQLNNSREIL